MKKIIPYFITFFICSIYFFTIHLIIEGNKTRPPVSIHNAREAVVCNKQNDSLLNVIMELKIDNGRNELIIERIREKDSLIVINATKNLE